MKAVVPFIQKFYIAFTRYYENELTNHAGAVAYYFLLSIIPIILLMLTIFDSILASHEGFSSVFFSLLSSFNQHLDKGLIDKLGLGTAAKGTLGFIGVLNLLWTSRLILNSIQRAFDVIFPSPKNRNFILTNVISIFIIPAAFLAVTFFAGLRISAKLAQDYVARTGLHIDVFSTFSSVGFVVPMAITFIAAFLCYRFLPVRRPGKMAAMQGAVLFSVLVFFLKLLFGTIMQLAKMNIVYGFIGTVIVVLIWVYFVCQLFFICAEYTYVCDRIDILVINKVFNVHTEDRKNFVERLLFGKTAKIFRRYADYYAKGSVIFNQGDESCDIYFVYKGRVDIFIENVEAPVGFVTEGDIVGEMAYLLEIPRTATAVAAENSIVFKIEPETFNELLTINFKLSRRIINSLCERLKDANDRLY
jgi:membrane protein